MVTLKEIAAEVGLDVSTVSHVLNRGDTRYSSATRQRVQSVARRLGYRPNSLARSMVRGRTNCIGYVGHSLRAPMTMEKVETIATLAQQHGYHVFLAGANESGDRMLERECLEELLTRRVDGLIINILPEADLAFYESLRRRGVAVVLTGHHSSPGGLPLVSVDIETGVYEATRHLLDLGHQDIALALGSFTARVPHNRLAGCQRALAERGLTLRAGRVLDGCLATAEAVRQFTREQLSRSSRPTAIIYNNDELALTGLRVIRGLGLAIPQDVSVVGVDDLPLAEDTWPPLTTVRQPRAELGEAALKLLIEQIDGRSVRPGNHVVLPTRLVVRESTGPVRAKQD